MIARGNHRSRIVAFSLALGTTSCGTPASPADDATSGTDEPTSSMTRPTTSVASEASTTSSNAESSTGSIESTGSTGAITGPELCRMQSTEDDCNSASDECRWKQAYRVFDIDGCALEPAPELSCWSVRTEGVGGCVEGPPMACEPIDVHPRYRTVDGQLQLLDFDCGLGPAPIDGETEWQVCQHEETLENEGEQQLPVCLCLCGGPVGETTDTGDPTGATTTSDG